MVQGTVIGVIGTVAGTVLGVILALTISDIISWFNNVLGLNLFDAYFVHYLPSYLMARCDNYCNCFFTLKFLGNYLSGTSCSQSSTCRGIAL